MRVTFWPYLKARELYRAISPLKSPNWRIEGLASRYVRKRTVFLNSGKTAIYLALAANGMRRMDEVLVPQYLGTWVLNTINRTAFPNTVETERTRAVIMFHQWGYPQRMDEIMSYARSKGWLVIEDCAHSFGSKYHGKTIGSFGDAAILSLSKNLPTILGGCLATDDERVIDYVHDYVAEKRGLWRGIASNIWIAAMFMSSGAFSPRTRELVRPLAEMLYSQLTEYPNPNWAVSRLSLKALLKLDEGITRQRKNLAIFKGYFAGDGYREDIEAGCEVVPLLAPYFDKKEKLSRIVESLRELDVETEIQHFDVERNVLQPDYRRCVPIPMHQNITGKMMHRICRAIAKGRQG